MVKGKYVIIAMVGIGMTLAGFGWWVRYNSSQKVLAVWGSDAVVSIRTSKRAELLTVVPSSETADASATTDAAAPDTISETITVEPPNCPSETIQLGPPVDITKAPGLIHARHHLVHEKGFNWDAPREEGATPDWKVALRFASDDQKAATILLDFASNRAYLLERNVEVGMRPIIADALKRFLVDFKIDVTK